MTGNYDFEAVVVGAGPNGLAAGITLARGGCSVLILEARDTIGGGSRTGEFTIPGFYHDICSTIHPLGVSSPFFQSIPLQDHGLEWVYPQAALAHPLDNHPPVIVSHSIEETASHLGRDANSYNRLFKSFVRRWDKLSQDLLGTLRIPKSPLLLAQFGMYGLFSARSLAQTVFKETASRAVFAGMAGHAMLRLDRQATSAFGLVLGISAHAVGWPMARGGSQNIVDGLASFFRDLGGEIQTGVFVNSLEELPRSRVVMFDVTPRQFLGIAGDQLPGGYRSQLSKFRYGPGVFKVDYALSGPIPWRDERIGEAGTVHIGGTMGEIERSFDQVWREEHPEKPFIILAQQSLFDSTRAPDGKHTAWAYCLVPHGSGRDMLPRIEAQIERFAPGFKDQVLASHTTTAEELQVYNPNYIGGDINGGVQDMRQLFTRPVPKWNSYATPVKGVYLCSSSTPPGGGVHGMCGYHAAHAALKSF